LQLLGRIHFLALAIITSKSRSSHYLGMGPIKAVSNPIGFHEHQMGDHIDAKGFNYGPRFRLVFIDHDKIDRRAILGVDLFQLWGQQFAIFAPISL
jgi:hypothetical protein